MKNLTILAILLTALFLLAGCGGGDDATTQAEEAAPATEAAPAAAEAVATHDCDGMCGMKDVPEDQLTEIEGKYFCAGCVEKAKAATKEAAGHG